MTAVAEWPSGAAASFVPRFRSSSVATFPGTCGASPNSNPHAALAERHWRRKLISQLGDRFLIIRLAVDQDPDAAALSIGPAALAHSEDEHREHTMRAELSAAICGPVAGADRRRAHRILTEPERKELVRLARYAGISRTPVDRDPYTGDLRAMPAPEGPAGSSSP